MAEYERPDWVLTQGQRKKTEKDNSNLAMDRILHYREIAATRYIWDVPEGVPPEYPEYAIFDTGGLGAVEYGGQKTPIQGIPALYGALGEILRWTPQAMGAYQDADLLQQRMAAIDPFVLIDKIPMYEKIRYLCGVQARAWNSLRRNLLYMVGPVIIRSVTGGEIGAVKMAEELEDGDDIVKMLKNASVDAEVLDLGGQDHTQNLISTINQLDAEILSLMGVPALGTSKTSGITAEEAGSMASEMRIILERGLRMRQHACDVINSQAGLSLSVRLNPDLQIPGPTEKDRTDGLTDNERTNDKRQEDQS